MQWRDQLDQRMLHRASVAALATAFVVALTVILSLDTLLPGMASLSDLQIGDVVERDIRAPRNITYVSEALTDRARAQASANVEPIYDSPDPTVARRQLDLARQILDYIANVRFDPFGTRAQKTLDLNAVSAFDLSDSVIDYILSTDDADWRAMDAEIMSVLERVMREPIRESDVAEVRDQLPVQISVRFEDRSAQVIISVVEDLLRPNQFANPQATEVARQEAAAAVSPETRSFAQGQVVVRSGTRLEVVDLEALAVFGLVQGNDTRWQTIARSMLASVVILVGMGLYITRYQRDFRDQLPSVALFAALFLIAVLGAQVFTNEGDFYLYPSAALSLLFVSLLRPELAVVSGLSLGVLFGIVTGGSLEVATMTALGSLVGAVTLRSTERVNTYFVAGLMVALVNIAVMIMFNLDAIADPTRIGVLLLYALLNGLFAAAAALAAMYIVTFLFNLPTSLKLSELSQPSQPLLQRLLREAPGTYQHSLQVANLSEQAATAIGANAQLIRVSALYHDIGKMVNPAFFVENQVEGVNPHDQLNDPYRSSDIIIQHVADGERLARQYHLPRRIVDFILEHHGTTLVSYFYRQAVERADDADLVDIDQFRYPGPRPLSRETAILMLADTCESTVRARKPTTRQQIAEIIDELTDQRMRDGQFDDSNLTSRDLKTIRSVFIEMLQAVYHPRINYPALPSDRKEKIPGKRETGSFKALTSTSSPERAAAVSPTFFPADEQENDAPMPEVPPLRRISKPGIPAPAPVDGPIDQAAKESSNDEP